MATVAAVMIVVTGVLVAVRTFGSPPPVPVASAATVLTMLADAAAGHPDALAPRPLTQRLRLSVWVLPNAACRGGAALVTTSGTASPWPAPLVQKVFVASWYPTDAQLREQGCDPAQTHLAQANNGFVLPPDERRLAGGLPTGIDAVEFAEPRLLDGRTPIAGVAATAGAVGQALDGDPDRWWSLWAEFVGSDYTAADQRVAAMRLAAERSDARVVDAHAQDLAGRPGVTVRVPAPPGWAELTFDVSTGALRQYRVVQALANSVRRIDITVLDTSIPQSTSSWR